ncbi:hypothetical protein SUGI_0858220 [Cryptomeria japonica]|nr:hypothetical protein SUGI_0858220 [Cryptomeria japonica]
MSSDIDWIESCLFCLVGSVQHRNRLQEPAPPPLKVQSPPVDLFSKSCPIPLLSPLLFQDMEDKSNQSNNWVTKENEIQVINPTVATKGYSQMFVWDTSHKQMAVFNGYRLLL